MRVLVTSTPGVGHVLPLVPIAAALRSAGHDVRWATGPDAQGLVRRAGFRAVVAGPAQADRMRRFRDGWPEVATLPPRQRRAVMFPTLFATLSAEQTFGDLVAQVADGDVDLIVHEPCELAAAPLAHRLGVPQVTVGFGRFIPDDLLRAAASRMGGVWEAVGADTPDDLGMYDAAYFHPLPHSFESVDGRHPVHLQRPSTGADPTFPPPARDGNRPMVYVSFGTEFGPAAPWPTVIGALGMLEVDALLTTGDVVDPEALGPLPEGIRAERWVAQRDAMAISDIVVSHGGSGTMIGAVQAALPHLVVPLGADHFENGDMIVERGLGVMLEPDQVDVDRLVAAIELLLVDRAIKTTVEAAAAEMAAMPSAEHSVEELARLVRPVG